ncbi:MAG TPA: hypothetical protein VNR38_02195 [Ureibacillus sp.]|nr:hypothetical protein [Ureibacillus sp.]
MGAIVTLVIGFGFTWIADGMVRLNIPGFMDTTLDYFLPCLLRELFLV